MPQGAALFAYGMGAIDPIAAIEQAATLLVVIGLYPTTTSKWLLRVYAIAVILFLLASADAPDVALFSFVFSFWIVGPAAIAALVVKRSRSAVWLWAFLILEGLIVVSTIWVWQYLIVVAPDAQNGIAMMLFPLLQYGAVLAAILIGTVAALMSRRTDESDGPTT